MEEALEWNAKAIICLRICSFVQPCRIFFMQSVPDSSVWTPVPEASPEDHAFSMLYPDMNLLEDCFPSPLLTRRFNARTLSLLALFHKQSLLAPEMEPCCFPCQTPARIPNKSNRGPGQAGAEQAGAGTARKNKITIKIKQIKIITTTKKHMRRHDTSGKSRCALLLKSTSSRCAHFWP